MDGLAWIAILIGLGLIGYVRFRVATAQYVQAYAASSGYEIEAVNAAYSRWERDTALVGHAETPTGSRDDRPRIAEPDEYHALDARPSRPA